MMARRKMIDRRIFHLPFACLSLALLAAPGCRVSTREPAAPPPPPKTLVVAHGEPDELIIPFSDRDEIPDSTTRFELSQSPGPVTGQAIRVEYDIQDYGGFAVSMPETDLLEYDTLSFDARLASGSQPVLYLQFQDDQKNRRKMAISAFVAPATQGWTTVRVPLDRLQGVAPESLRKITQMALVFHPGNGSAEFDEFILSATGGPRKVFMNRIPYPEKKPVHLPRGYGAWCYGEAAYAASIIAAYNADAPDEQRIRYVFPWAGYVDFSGDRYNLTWSPALARQLADSLGSNVLVFPMIDGLSRGADQLSEAAWNRLAAEIAGCLNGEAAWAGLHLDIEPHEDDLYRLFSALKSKTDKPVTVAVGAWTADTFRYVDMAVLMGYDWAADPETFAGVAAEKIPRFLADARAGGGRAMIGVPAIATHREFESWIARTGQPAQVTGYRMADFVQGSLAALGDGPRQDAWVGLSVWAIHSQEALHGSRDTMWYYPGRLSNDVLSLLRQPLAR